MMNQSMGIGQIHDQLPYLLAPARALIVIMCYYADTATFLDHYSAHGIDAIGVTRVTLSPGVKKKLSRQHFFGKSFPGEEHVSLV